MKESEVRIREALTAFHPDIAVYDIFRDYVVGNPNDDVDMIKTLHVLGRLNREGNPLRVMLIVYHSLTGKAGAAKAIGFDRSSFGRNSKVVLGYTRSQINLATYKANSNDTLIVASGKCNNALEFEPFGSHLTTIP